MTDPELNNALCGLALAVVIVAVSLACMAFRRTKRNRYLGPPIADSRCSITRFREMHKP